MRIALCIACGLFALAPAERSQAQTKLAAKMTCAKPDPNYNAPVGDDAHHVLTLVSQKCTWSQGELGGDRLKDETDTFTSDVSGNLSHDRGYGAGSVASGDKYVVKFKGTTTLNGEKPVSAECTWSFKSGTGKLKGLTGKGTCKGTFRADGTSTWDIQGEYKLP